MSKRFLVYALICGCAECVDAGEPRYVGYAGDLVERFRGHVSDAMRFKRVNDGKEDWIRTHGHGNISIELLQEYSSEAEMKAGEKYWIAFWLEAGARLFNLNGGGGGVYEHTQATKDTIAASMRKIFENEDERERRVFRFLSTTRTPEAEAKRVAGLVEYWSDQTVRDEHGNKVRAWYANTPGAREIVSQGSIKMWEERKASGWTTPQSTRDAISAGLTGVKHSEEALARGRVKDRYCKECDAGPFTRRGLNNHSRKHTGFYDREDVTARLRSAGAHGDHVKNKTPDLECTLCQKHAEEL